jgi:hypothetical protein
MSAIICWFAWFIVNGLVLRIMDLIFVVNGLTFVMIVLCVTLYILIKSYSIFIIMMSYFRVIKT